MSDSEVETDICDTEQCNDVDDANNNDNAVESFEAKLVIKGRSTVWNYFIFKGSKVKIVENKEARESIFKKLEKDLKEIVSDTEEAVSVEDKNPKKKRKLGLDFDESDDESVEEEEEEMKAYKLEPTLDKDSYPLEWWRVKKNKYPYMIQLVKKYLCIPATSTQAERVFSALGFILNKRRLCLSGANVKAQLFLHDNLEL